jgi:predicted nucleic acid-binding Zn ribbon protein
MSDRRRKAGRRGDKAARQARVRQIANILRQYDQSPFQYEAACRHGLRAQLCLHGWDFHEADAEAHKLVQAALDLIGARRPPWWEGQPDATREGVRAHERTWCARCGKRLPEDARHWCSDVCREAAKTDRRHADMLERKAAAERAGALAWKRKSAA